MPCGTHRLTQPIQYGRKEPDKRASKRVWRKRQRYVFRKRSMRGRALRLVIGVLVVMGLIWLMPWSTLSSVDVDEPEVDTSEGSEDLPEQAAIDEQPEQESAEDRPQDENAPQEDAPPPEEEEEGASNNPPPPSSPSVRPPSSSTAQPSLPPPSPPSPPRVEEVSENVLSPSDYRDYDYWDYEPSDYWDYDSDYWDYDSYYWDPGSSYWEY